MVFGNRSRCVTLPIRVADDIFFTMVPIMFILKYRLSKMIIMAKKAYTSFLDDAVWINVLGPQRIRFLRTITMYGVPWTEPWCEKKLERTSDVMTVRVLKAAADRFFRWYSITHLVMGGPNLEIFKFSIYLFVPIVALVHFGDPQWYREKVVPVSFV